MLPIFSYLAYLLNSLAEMNLDFFFAMQYSISAAKESIMEIQISFSFDIY